MNTLRTTKLVRDVSVPPCIITGFERLRDFSFSLIVMLSLLVFKFFACTCIVYLRKDIEHSSKNITIDN